ncbi:Xanthine dehydrogenase [Coccomyxa sp. Obi]|nr:Xanthine dehydrogenase [Coccomyxa sp. Obi]
MASVSLDPVPLTDRGITLFLNGKEETILNPSPDVLLLTWLHQKGLTGTKLGCGEGGCGACTVVLSDATGNPRAVNSCLRPLVACHGQHITTIEGLGSQPTTDKGLAAGVLGTSLSALDPIQETIGMFNGSQCGFCTPGMVMTMKSLAAAKGGQLADCSPVEIEDCFAGNICRCTGYRPIMCGMKTFGAGGNAEELKTTPGCLVDGDKGYATGFIQHEGVTVASDPAAFVGPTSRRMRPMALHLPEGTKKFTNSRQDHFWYRPASLGALFALLEELTGPEHVQRSDIKLVCGNTSAGIFKKNAYNPPHLVGLGHLRELQHISTAEEIKESGALVIGAAVSLESLREQLCTMDGQPDKPSAAGRLANYLLRIAGRQVRSAGSVMGNLAMCKRFLYPSDAAMALMASGASVGIQSALAAPAVACPLEDFLQRPPLAGSEVAVNVSIPVPPAGQEPVVAFYKVAKRIQNSHALVNAGFWAFAHPDTGTVEGVRVVIGNLKLPKERPEGYLPEWGRPAMRMPSVEAAFQETKWKETGALEDLIRRASLALLKDVGSESDYPADLQRTTTETFFLQRLALGLIFKYIILLGRAMGSPAAGKETLEKVASSIFDERRERAAAGGQDFIVVSNETPVSEPVIKTSAFLQATGEAKYTCDLPLPPGGGLEGAYVLSTQAAAKFELKWLPGVQGAEQFWEDLRSKFGWLHEATILSAEDLKLGEDRYARNTISAGPPGFPGDTLFAQGRVIYYGQPVAVVLHPDLAMAQELAAHLRDDGVSYEPEHAVLTLDQAVAEKSFLPAAGDPGAGPQVRGTRIKSISRPPGQSAVDFSEFEANTDKYLIVEGSQVFGGQAHFYLETQGAMAVPGEGGSVEVFASTQSATSLQQKIASILGAPMTDVKMTVRRLGGGFGGKEPQSAFVACVAAFAARKLGKPVRLVLDRNTDMEMIGKRHPFAGKFKVAVQISTKKIVAMEIKYTTDGGCTYDTTFPVTDLAVLQSDNAYFIPTFVGSALCARTNRATSTAMRSFGVIQATTITEMALEHTAEALHKIALERGDIPNDAPVDYDTIRSTNFYKLFQPTPFGQALKYCLLDPVWRLLKKKADYDKRRTEVVDFNSKHRWRKRGIALMPLRYGISFTSVFMNQSGALVNVYSKDGSVLVAHGGIEMGQGLDTKIQQIAAYTLNIKSAYVKVSPNSTSAVPNAPGTGASTGSDLNGGAVRNACLALKADLETMLDAYVESQSDPAAWRELMGHWQHSRQWYSPALKDEDDGYDFWPLIISKAFTMQIPLSKQGFFKAPQLSNVATSGPALGAPFYYFNFAAACSEVELDLLTGEFNAVRTDIVYDAGHSLNPAIDIGQVEGGFVMGLGCVTTEELVFDEAGRLTNPGTWEYKPPCNRTIPHRLFVTLYPGVEKADGHAKPLPRINHLREGLQKIDPYGIQSSKTAGEPPLVLAASVFLALRRCARAAREALAADAGKLRRDADLLFRMDVPATTQCLQSACTTAADLQEYAEQLCKSVAV